MAKNYLVNVDAVAKNGNNMFSPDVNMAEKKEVYRDNLSYFVQKLSDRMRMNISMIDEKKVADIGCDHAFVSISLIEEGISEHVIAMDVRKGPLDIAKNNISQSGCDDVIETRLSDGFEKLAVGEVDCALIAGMGGPLMVNILKNGKAHTDAGLHLVLQPQSDIEQVRRYLFDIGYEIVREDMLEEDDKYYVTMKAIPMSEVIEESNSKNKANSDVIIEQIIVDNTILDKTVMDKAMKANMVLDKSLLDIFLPDKEMSENDSKRLVEFRFGKFLLKHKHPVLKDFLVKEKIKNQQLQESLLQISSDKAKKRKLSLEEEAEIIREALAYYYV